VDGDLWIQVRHRPSHRGLTRFFFAATIRGRVDKRGARARSRKPVSRFLRFTARCPAVRVSWSVCAPAEFGWIRPPRRKPPFLVIRRALGHALSAERRSTATVG
jgi:hypothetical protein